MEDVDWAWWGTKGLIRTLTTQTHNLAQIDSFFVQCCDAIVVRVGQARLVVVATGPLDLDGLQVLELDRHVMI